ncbi:glycosyltransferase family 4 protein [Aliiroseovarius sp. 2305UL8-7]|uniref:glycosyltransferase family 4 protein n=1 Tax=Aliiroseovarius conchicola TaxID=3121637 RepID=UPI003527E34B
MRIVLTVNAAWNALNFRRPVIEALLDRGDRVTILAPTDPASKALRDMGCDVVDLEMDVKGLSPRLDAGLVGQFAQHFRELNPDAVLSYTIKNNIFGAMAARRLGIPFLPNVSGLGTGFLSGRVLRLVVEGLYRFAFRALPIVFFQNPDDRALFVERNLIAHQHTRLLPGSGIDLEHFAPVPQPRSKTTVFLMISRLLRDKGVMEFAQAAYQLRTERTDVQFQILGAVDTANRSAISPLVLAEWVKDGRLEHLGEHQDVRPFIAKADCIVLPSYREGAPRTLIEAASMARPLIATDVPGCRHVIDEGVTGLLCPSHSVSGLCQSIEAFQCLPPTKRKAMGEAGREKMAREHDQRIVVTEYLRAVDALTLSGRTGGAQQSA